MARLGNAWSVTMKIALVDGQRREAEPGLSGSCPGCGSLMIPKCGERRVRHWAHRGQHHCDHWWEPETQWHRDWKNRFPSEWQEVFHRAESGEKHIADVKTAHGCVIEFQHSFLKPEERRSREAFYRPMAWVVDCTQPMRSAQNFCVALSRFRSRLDLTTSLPLGTYRLLGNWADSGVDVYFDFGDAQDNADSTISVLWHFGLNSQNGGAIMTPISREGFVAALMKGEPVRDLFGRPVKRVVHLPVRVSERQLSRSLHGFEQYWARRRRSRRF